MELICPVCRKDDAIQKVSAIFSSGVQATTLELETYAQSAKGMTISKQALRLAPPAEPKKPGGLHWLLWIVGLILSFLFDWVFALSAMILLPSLAREGEASPCTACGCIGFPLGLVLPVVALVLLHSFLLKRSKSRYSREFPVWQAMMERWNRLYYCSRDDVVFDPATGESVGPEALGALLSLTPPPA